jgi:hypothetical protein
MPFLKRGKARARQYRKKIVPPQTQTATPPPQQTNVPTPIPVSESISESDNVNENVAEEQQKVSYQEITYRVPKEERLLDLPLEEEVFEKEEEKEEKPYKPLDSEEHVSIGAVLKKKKKK